MGKCTLALVHCLRRWLVQFASIPQVPVRLPVLLCPTLVVFTSPFNSSWLFPVYDNIVRVIGRHAMRSKSFGKMRWLVTTILVRIGFFALCCLASFVCRVVPWQSIVLRGGVPGGRCFVKTRPPRSRLCFNAAAAKGISWRAPLAKVQSGTGTAAMVALFSNLFTGDCFHPLPSFSLVMSSTDGPMS